MWVGGGSHGGMEKAAADCRDRRSSCLWLWYPQGTEVVGRWMTGPEDNRVAAAFAALDMWMEQGFGETVPVLWVERYGLP